jgi:pilus assembly protein CpaF
VRALVDAEAGVLGASARDRLADRVTELAVGLGPLQPLLADPAVEEVMVCGTAPVWVERAGRLERTEVAFATEAALRETIERILAPVGRRVDEAEPLCDARLPDGSRVNVVVPPLALDGPSLTIRRFRARGIGPDELVAAGTLGRPLLGFLARAVQARCTLLICGGTGSGKTTTLNALSEYIGPEERIVTIEDAAELRLRQPHVVRLEARPPNLEGAGGIGLRDLVRQALRMRPDRLVVGEVRGSEVIDLLAALNTGHEGGCGTLHANKATDVPARLEALACAAGLSREAVHSQLAAALDVVVHLVREPGGGRRRVAEVCLLEREASGLVVAVPALTFAADGRVSPGPSLDALSRRCPEIPWSP